VILTNQISRHCFSILHWTNQLSGPYVGITLETVVLSFQKLSVEMEYGGKIAGYGLGNGYQI